MNKEKPCPFCGERAYFYRVGTNRIMHKEDCYFKYDTIFYIKDENKTWNKRYISLAEVMR